MIKTCVFDIDGVLLDFHDGFYNYVKKQLGPDTPKEEIIAKEKSFEWDFVNSEDFCKLPAIIDPKIFNSLCSGTKVHLITNLPSWLMKSRTRNIDALGFKYNSINYGGFETYDEEYYPTKSEVIRSNIGIFSPFIFVDDAPENCVDIFNNCESAKVILLKGHHQYPKGKTPYKKTTNWSDLTKIIEDLIGKNPGK